MEFLPIMSDGQKVYAGFVGGGGTWLMEVLYADEGSRYWNARWEVWNQDAPDRRIWRVAYGRGSERATPQEGPVALQDTALRLAEALRRIRTFAEAKDCAGFAQCFADALDTLDSGGEKLHGYHKDLGPDGHLSHQARMILDACQKAWVFGGMGSWNDMMFDGDEQKEYEAVSEQLFQTLNQAICDAANQSCYRRNREAEGDAGSSAP